MGDLSGRWSNEQFQAFSDDALVVALDLTAQPVRLPRELTDRSGVVQGAQAWVDMLTLVHHRYRGQVVRAWWRCHEEPGSVIECEVLAELPGTGRYRRQCIKFANLLDDPGVEAILLAVVDLGATAEIEMGGQGHPMATRLRPGPSPRLTGSERS